MINELPFLAAYHPTLLVIAALSVVTLVQNFLTAPLSYVKEEQVPGMPLRLDHGSLSFRAIRTYQNSAESLPAFLAAAAIAIVAGTSPLLVNIAALAYLAALLAFWWLYYAGIGRQAGGPRTFAFVACLIANIVIAVGALFSLF